jgi:hypothetical protein
MVWMPTSLLRSVFAIFLPRREGTSTYIFDSKSLLLLYFFGEIGGSFQSPSFALLSLLKLLFLFEHPLNLN